MKVIVKILPRQAAALGLDQDGDVEYTVRPSQLTDRQRATLAAASGSMVASLPLLDGVPFAGAEDIPALLDAIQTRRDVEDAARAEALKRSNRERADYIIAAIVAYQAPQRLPAIIMPGRPGYSESLLKPLVAIRGDRAVSAITIERLAGDYGRDIAELVVADPRIIARQAEAESLAERWTSGYAEAVAADAARKAAERLEKEAAAARRAAQLADWVATHGSDNDRKRFARGLLPEDEIINAIRADAFAPLAAFPRYEKITRGDLEAELDDPDEVDAVDPEFWVDKAESASAAEFDLLERIEAAIKPTHPEAECVLRVHHGSLSYATISRKSVIVTITVGELTLSRVYGVPDAATGSSNSFAAVRSAGEITRSLAVKIAAQHREYDPRVHAGLMWRGEAGACYLEWDEMTQQERQLLDLPSAK